MDLAQEPHLPPHAAHGLTLQLLGYVIDWAGFALLTRWLAGTVGRGHVWPRFIAVWNWCNVIQYLLLVAAALPPLLGLPDIVGANRVAGGASAGRSGSNGMRPDWRWTSPACRRPGWCCSTK